jgi:hypothetical protein
VELFGMRTLIGVVVVVSRLIIPTIYVFNVIIGLCPTQVSVNMIEIANFIDHHRLNTK